MNDHLHPIMRDAVNAFLPKTVQPAMTEAELQAALAASGFKPGPGVVGTAETLAARLRYRRPAGECPTCDAYRNDGMMPSHTASDRCESGKHRHCTCDTCF